nr:ABC transporter permease [Aggregatilinea lenta]
MGKNIGLGANAGETALDSMRASRTWHTTRSLLLRGGPLIALLVLAIYLSFASPHFMTESNLVNVARRTSVLAIMAVGQTFVILTGGIDLSVGAVAALSASAAAVTMTQQVNVLGLGIKFGPVDFLPGLIIALLVGGAAGLLNGLLITKGNIPDFIATLGTLEAFRGMALLTTNGLPVPSYYSDAPKARSALPETMIRVGTSDFLGIPIAAWLALLVVLAGWLLLRYSTFGRGVYAVGGNREAARVSGININRTKLGVYLVSGVLAALGGFVLAGRLNSANALMSEGDELTSIAAVVIGGTNLIGGVGGVIGSVIGAVITGVIDNGLNLLNVTEFWQRIVMGSVIVVVVIFDQWRRRRFHT